MRTTSPAVWAVGGALGVGAVLMGASIALTTFQSSSTSDAAVVVEATYQAPNSPARTPIQLPNVPVPQPSAGAPTASRGDRASVSPGGSGPFMSGQSTVTLPPAPPPPAPPSLPAFSSPPAPPAPVPVLTMAPRPTATVTTTTFVEAGVTLVPLTPTPQVAPTKQTPHATVPPTSPSPTATGGDVTPQPASPTSAPAPVATVCVTAGPAPQAASPVPGWWPSWLPFPTFTAHPTQAQDSNATRAHGCPTPDVTATTVPQATEGPQTTGVPKPSSAEPTTVAPAPDAAATKSNQGRSNGDLMPTPHAAAKTTVAPTAAADAAAHGKGPNVQPPGQAKADAQPAATRTKSRAAAD